MTTITINEHSRVGKTLLELAKILSVTDEGAEIEINVTSEAEEKSPYSPEFVKKVLESARSEKRTVIDPNDIWGSLGLK
jgi:hypothetical protein